MYEPTRLACLSRLNWATEFIMKGVDVAAAAAAASSKSSHVRPSRPTCEAVINDSVIVVPFTWVRVLANERLAGIIHSADVQMLNVPSSSSS